MPLRENQLQMPEVRASARTKPAVRRGVRRVFAPTTGKEPAGRTSGSSLGRSPRQPDQLAHFDLSNVTS
jgi:hypothetical protein